MITIRRAEDRGRADFGWLDSRHTFSFGEYYDPRHVGFGALRVINEDRVQPGAGFPTHGHRDMEILSYVLDGALEHRDSLGTGSVIRPGEIQRMSAGTGIRHSEYNASRDAPVHFLQIWLLPDAAGLEPGYEQVRIPDGARDGRLARIAGPAGGEGAVRVHQDASLHAALLAPGDVVRHALAGGRRAFVHVARGAVSLQGERLGTGDGAAVTGLAELELAGLEDGTDVLVFDLA